MSEHIDTVVVGGGQAGISVGWHLKRNGREHVILDRGTIGDTWRRRWAAASQDWWRRTVRPGSITAESAAAAR